MKKALKWIALGVLPAMVLFTACESASPADCTEDQTYYLLQHGEYEFGFCINNEGYGF